MASQAQLLTQSNHSMLKKLTRLLFLFFIILQSNTCFAKPPIQIAIVIDDIGNNYHDLQALQLPATITFSILPYTPYAKNIASLAEAQGRELLLHVPMQAKTDNEKLGKGALMLNMQELAFKTTLKKALNYLPNATGINNHMGSTLTEHIKPMRWTMEILNKQGLYFLDSRTTAQTIAESTAKISGTPALRRHVFLDNIKTDEAMQERFQHAIELGETQLSIVIIAHPYPETIRFLAQKTEQKNNKIELVSLKELLPKSARLAMAKKRNERQQANNTVNAQSKQIQ